MRDTNQRRRQPLPPRLPPARDRPPARPDARALLDERYARGEIDRQEYLQRREDLSR